MSSGAARPPAPPSTGALLFVDDIDGGRARLLGVDAFEVPAHLLPAGTKEGAWVRLSLEPAPPPPEDDAATLLRQRLGRDDDGGDIKL